MASDWDNFVRPVVEHVPPPPREICASVYLIADVMASAPTDPVGNRIMGVEALVKALVGRGVTTITARNAIDWAWRKDILRRHSKPDEYPEILQDTITLSQIGNGDYADWLGARARASKPETKPNRNRRPSKNRKPRPLTVPQTEAVVMVAECKGNIAEAAQRLGKDRKTVEEAYKAGLAKLGKQAVKHGTRTLSRDRRGQVEFAKEEDRRG